MEINDQGSTGGLSPEEMEELLKLSPTAEAALVPPEDKPLAIIGSAPSPTIDTTPSGLSPEEEAKHNISRDTGEITLARVENYNDLNAENEVESDKIALEVTRKVWKEFAVHGVEINGKLMTFSDLDGKGGIMLLQMAGFDLKDLQYVNKGEFREGGINFDTGGKTGLVIEDGGKTAFMDHHGEDSKNDTSATKVVYETLTNFGLLEKTPDLDKFVEFVTLVDNRTYPDEEKYFKDAHRTVLGMERFIKPEQLLEYLSSGRSPTEILTPEEIEQMGLTKRSVERKLDIEDSLKTMEVMQRLGYIVDSEKYGKIAVDYGGKLKDGYMVARACGCDTYFNWNPKSNGFFISSTHEITEDFEQSINVRGHMIMKPASSEEPLKADFREMLIKLIGKDYFNKDNLTGQLKNFW